MIENKLAIMPLKHYQNACDKIKEKTSTEDLIESGELTEKIEDVFEAGKNAEWNEIKGTASGEIIGINDMSPIEHEMGVKVRLTPPNILENYSITYTQGSSWGGSGLTTNQYTTNYTALQPLIDVFENYTYKIPRFQGTVTFYDADGKNGTQLDRTGAYGDFEFTIPVGKTKIGIAYLHNYTSNINEVYCLTPTTDISAVKVMKLGKNLFKLENISVANGTIIEELENGAIVSGNVSSGDNAWVNGWFIPNKNGSYIYLKKGSIVYVSADITWLNIDNYTKNKAFGFYLYSIEDNGGPLAYHTNYPTNDNINKTFRIILQLKITESGNYYPIFTLNSCTMKIENIQVSFDESETHEPYIEPTEYTPDADGVVNGVTSLYPSTTLMTDTDGVIIDATYNKAISNVDDVPERIEAVYEEGQIVGQKDEHNRMWDVLQPSGSGEYSYNSRIGYFGSGKYTFDNFYPKYDIRPTGDAAYLFYDWSYGYGNVEGSFIQRLKDCNVVLDTSKATTLDYIFAYNKALAFPTVDFTGTVGTQSLCFYACSEVITIEKIIVNENVIYNNWFSSCFNLENLIVAGIIGQNGFNTQDCTKLSKASWQSIIGCLSTTTSGLSITGSLASIKKAFETSPGANDGDTSTEWLELETSRSNWKINLL